jgi:hypothetical protein
MIIKGKDLPAKRRGAKAASSSKTPRATKSPKKKALKPGVTAARPQAVKPPRKEPEPFIPSTIVEAAVIPPQAPMEAVNYVIGVMEKSRVAHERNRAFKLRQLVIAAVAAGSEPQEILDEVKGWLRENP